MEEFKLLSKIIHQRRSVFPEMYTDKEITNDTIQAILENANWAPTHKKTEPWRFKIMKGGALIRLSDFQASFYATHTPKDQFSEMKLKKTKLKPLKSACVIAICMQRDTNESIPEWEEIAAVACAVQNIWLSCSSLGIGSYWSTPDSIQHMDELLQLEKGERCIGLFYMGYMKAAEYKSERGNINDKIVWMKY